MPPGSVQFETIIETGVIGTVVQDVNGMESGLIGYAKDDQSKTIMFFAKDCDPKNVPKLDEKVRNCLYN